MSTGKLTLTSLPVEIQSAIYELLDPISLISVGQTNSQLRSMIQPTRHHFLESLLALECDEKGGGLTPILWANRSGFFPDWNRPEWQTMRWACSGCLRLLPHTAFDNRSLLRLRYRKPIPGSPAATLITSWNPSGRFGRRRRKGEPYHEYLPEEKQIRRRYKLATSYGPRDSNGLPQRLANFQECGMSRFEEMTLSEFIELSEEQEHEILKQEAHDIEWVRCGFKRGLRKCLECRHQRNNLNPYGYLYGGTERVPFMPSRQLPFPSVTDRYFPDIGDALGYKRPAVNPPVYITAEDLCTRNWLTHMVRCPGCAQWQESRHFRLGEIWTTWRANARRPAMQVGGYWISGEINRDDTIVTREYVDSLRCSRCFVQEHGREALGKEILQWLKRVIDLDKGILRREIGYGWSVLKKGSQEWPTSFGRQVRAVAREPCAIVERVGEKHDFGAIDLALFRESRAQWFELWDRMIKKGKSAWFWKITCLRHWHNSYDELEAMYVWVKAIGKEEENVDALIDWALENKTVQGRTISLKSPNG
jgi:hypothetical protein